MTPWIKKYYTRIIGVVISVNLLIAPFIIATGYKSALRGIEYFFLGGIGFMAVYCRIIILRRTKQLEKGKLTVLYWGQGLENTKNDSQSAQHKIISERLSNEKLKVSKCESEIKYLNIALSVCLILTSICALIYFFIK